MNTVNTKYIQCIVLVLICLFSAKTAFSQDASLRCATDVSGDPQYAIDQNQFGGLYLTASGTIRILLVFTSYSDDNSSHAYWPAHQPPTFMSNFIDTSVSIQSTNFANLTNYFNQMSRGLYQVIGEAIYAEAPNTKRWCDSVGRAKANADVLQNAVNPFVNFASYDNWRYDSNYHHTNVADGTVDMIVMVWRGSAWPDLGEASLGYGSSITLDGKTIKFGYRGNNGSGVTCNYPSNHWPEKLLQTMTHEIGHWLVSGDHPYDTYNPVFSMWGILGAQYVAGACMNSYERERVGWINCTPVTEENVPISDYITTGVSYKYHPSNGDANEYIYFENHQKLSIYDDASTNPNDKGIYVFQQKGIYNGTNNIRVLPQDGRYNWQNPSYNTSCFTGSSVPAFKKVSVQRDQTGYSYRDELLTSFGYRDWMLVYIDMLGNQLCGGFMRGDAPFFGAFNNSVNTVLSPWSNPNTNTMNDSTTTFGMEIISQNGNTITAQFYTTSPLNAPPSKPQFVQAAYNSSNKIVITWTANLESDVFSGGGYNIYREIYHGATTVQNIKLNSSLVTATTYIDNNNSLPIDIQNGVDLFSRYKVEAVDNTAKVSVKSESSEIYLGKAVNGSIGSNTTWNGKYVVFDNLTVNSGSTLTIQPSSVVRFAANKSLTASGKLTASGTPSSPIYFISLSGSGSPGSWGSIILSGTGAHTSWISNAIVQYGTEIFVNSVSTPSYYFVVDAVTFNNMINAVRSYSSNGWVTNCNINYPRDHGIIAENGSTLACYHNKIKKTQWEGGAGIIYSGGSWDYCWGNDITGFDWGIAAIWGSSPGFGHPYNNNHNNRITNCTIGLEIYNSSYPWVGVTNEPMTWGNSIHSNLLSADVYNCPDNIVYAQKVYWGPETPQSWQFQLSNVYDFDWSGYETTDPWQNDPPLQKSGSSGNETIVQNTDKLRDGIKLRQSGRYSEAQEFFKSFIARNPQAPSAYVELYKTFNDTTAGDIANVFEKFPKEVPPVAKLLQSNLYLKRGEIDKAKRINRTLAAENPDGKVGIRAKLNNFYIALYDENDPKEAENILNEVLAKPELSTDIEVSLAKHALESFVPLDVESYREFQKQLSKAGRQVPDDYRLSQNYPNPFNPSTIIEYQIPNDGLVVLQVYDMLGREVWTLVNENKPAGYHTVTFNAGRLTSGMYFYRLVSQPVDGGSKDIFTAVKRMMLVK